MKADPTTVVAAGAVTSFSPILGEYSIILLGAVCGALVALSTADLHGRKALAFIFRSATTATMLASFAAAYLSDILGHSAQEMLLPVAFLLALAADRLPELKDHAMDWLRKGKT